MKLVLILAVSLTVTWAQSVKQVAITIDDVPVAGGGTSECDLDGLRQFSKALLEPLQRGHVPFTGFVNEGGCKNLTPAQLRGVLDLWLDSGGDLGNHTATHRDLNDTPLERYEQDIIKRRGRDKRCSQRQGQASAILPPSIPAYRD